MKKLTEELFDEFRVAFDFLEDNSWPETHRFRDYIQAIWDYQTGSEEWLRDFAEQCGISYERLMSGARAWIDGEQCIVEHGTDTGRDAFYANEEEFWKHYQALKGPVREEDRGVFITCSC